MAFVGYVRVSKREQSFDLQMDALTAKGCIKIFADKGTGALFDRKELEACLMFLREGDVLVVYRLDRLGRSLMHLIETVETLKSRGIGFISLSEAIDTTTPGGKLAFHLFGAIAEFERELIRERTLDGLEAARARGKKGGRKPVMADPALARKVRLAQKLYADKTNDISEICQHLHISRATLYRWVNMGKKKEIGA